MDPISYSSTLQFGRMYFFQGKYEAVLSLYEKGVKVLKASQLEASGTCYDMESKQKECLKEYISLRASTIAQLGLAASRVASVQERVEELSLKESKVIPLFERLDRFTVLKAGENPVLIGEPSIQAVPFRPIFYDLAYNGIEFPTDNLQRLKEGKDRIAVGELDLQEQDLESKPASFFSSLWGR
jgi:hypothetical protein